MRSVQTASAISCGRDEIRVIVEIPAALEARIDGSFYAVTRTGESVEARAVRGRKGVLRVIFDRDELGALAEIDEPGLRILGGFDPDEAYYGYEGLEEDGDLPVAAMWDYFVLQGAVDPVHLRG